jgi:thermitase
MKRIIKTQNLKTTTWMIATTFILTLILALLAGTEGRVSWIPGVPTVTSATDEYETGRVVAELRPQSDPQRVAAAHNMTVEDNLINNIYLFRFSDSRTVWDAVDELEDDNRNVKWAEPDYYAQVPEVDQRAALYLDQRAALYLDGQSPTEYFQQYAIPLIKAREAQAIATGVGITVAVIDTGVDMSHPVFKSVASGYDYVDKDSNPDEVSGGPAYGHGTMVAGIIALVAPGATIMPLRAFTPGGAGAASDVALAIRKAVLAGADVINMSFGYSTRSAAIEQAIHFADVRGATLIAAAGNRSSSIPQYPAEYNEVLAVGATDSSDNIASFSNRGSWVDVGAPGVSIYSAYPGGQFAWWDGTSFAAPFVSGAAALVISSRSGDPLQKIPGNTDTCCGGLFANGRINAWRAVQ